MIVKASDFSAAAFAQTERSLFGPLAKNQPSFEASAEPASLP